MTYIAANDYHGYTPEHHAPHDTDVESGKLIRLETNGEGKVVKRVIGKAPTKAFGLPVGEAAELREQWNAIAARNENTDMPHDQLCDEAVRILAAHGPLTRVAVARKLRIFAHQVSGVLDRLQLDGRVRCFTDPEAGCRKYLWAVTDT